MTPDVLDPERMMNAVCSAHSSEARSPTRMEAIRSSARRKDTLSAFPDHVVSEEPPAEGEHPTRI